MTFLIVAYARTSLNEVYKKYQTYHKLIHEELLKREGSGIAKQGKEDQTAQRQDRNKDKVRRTNTAFRVRHSDKQQQNGSSVK